MPNVCDILGDGGGGLETGLKRGGQGAKFPGPGFLKPQNVTKQQW